MGLGDFLKNKSGLLPMYVVTHKGTLTLHRPTCFCSSAGHLAGGEGCQLARWDLMETLEADVSLAMWIRRPP